MRPSNIALALAAKAPHLTAAAVRCWAAMDHSPPHWLLLELTSRLGVTLRKRVTLPTGHSLDVDPLDFLGREILRVGCHEWETVSLFQALLEPGMVMVDVGAHIGHHTIVVATLVQSAGMVHAFEPDPKTFERLHANVALNRLGNVVCNQIALSDETADAPLYQGDGANVGGHSLRPRDESTAKSTVVHVATLDDYAALARFDRLDLLKADIEGAELLLLMGGARTIERFKPLLILEFSSRTTAFGYTQDDLYRQLVQWGYSAYTVGPLPLERYAAEHEAIGDDVYFNVLAVPRDKVPHFRNRGLFTE